MRNKLLFGIITLITFSLNSPALAQEDAAFADLAASEEDAANTARGLEEMGMPKTETREDEAAADDEEMTSDTRSNGSIGSSEAITGYDSAEKVDPGIRPAYMLPPYGGVYQKARLALAIGGTVTGFIGLGLTTSLGLASIPLSFSYAGGYITSALSIGSLIIMAPISNALSKKSGVWSYHNKHKAIDTAAWTLFGLSIGLYVAQVTSAALLLTSGGVNAFYVAMSLEICNIVIAAMSVTSMVLFGVKGIKCIKMANYARRYNKNVYGSAEKATNKLTIMPNITPVVSKNSEITGGVLGVSAIF